MERHINIVAALQIGYSILGLVIGAVLFILFHFIGDFIDEQEAKLVLPIIAKIVITVVVIFSIPGIIAGIVVVSIPKAIFYSRKFYYVLAGAVLNFVIMKYFQQDHLAPLMIVVMLLTVKWEARKKKKNNHE